ncbi:hypothetical protein RFI_08810 [Reticulomyxa filosa]|uniref:Uncharacterized protein n=1 Tax=Reticulomyxa filosa TaxID=46433 RepID=X6NPU7_RETFI|nr:hypothetical protein RFI_08810 [Reticulomyxa filosa]|eukprot:ETO28320.1 hypothetical protein RFI_08810 [Reticulomyxa filosa]
MFIHSSPFDDIRKTRLRIQLRDLLIADVDFHNKSNPQANNKTGVGIGTAENKTIQKEDQSQNDKKHTKAGVVKIWKKRIRFSGLLVQLFHNISSYVYCNWQHTEKKKKIEQHNKKHKSNENREIDVDDHSNVIIHGDPEENGQTSYFDIEAPLDAPKVEDQLEESQSRDGWQGKNTPFKIPKYLRKIEIFGFIPNIRAVLTPLQLALFLDIVNAISASTDLIAEYNQEFNHDSSAPEKKNSKNGKQWTTSKQHKHKYKHKHKHKHKHIYHKIK